MSEATESIGRSEQTGRYSSRSHPKTHKSPDDAGLAPLRRQGARAGSFSDRSHLVDGDLDWSDPSEDVDPYNNPILGRK
jgi:hypothetical protein